MALRSLVTGGAGFIGNHLVKALVEKGHEVVVLDNLQRGNKLDKDVFQAIEFIEGDVRNYDTVLAATARCDSVFHLAAVLGVDIVADNPVETMETEVIGLRNVANSCLRNAIGMLCYASTSGVYGKAAIETAVGEEFEVSPNSSYSIAKRYNEIYLKALFQEKRQPSVSIRYFNVYGPKQDQRMVIPRFFEQAMQGNPLTVFGSGGQTRDFTYVDDVVQATILLSEKSRGCEIVNRSHGHEINIFDLAHKIKNLCGSSSPVALIDQPKGRYDFEVERRVGDSSKLRAIIGDWSSIDLDTGLARIWEGYGGARK
jgi:UDP-glucose 4-epimerase